MLSVQELLIQALVLLVAVLHLWFFALESYFWTKPLGLKVFRQSVEKARASKVLAFNQGFYNGILALGLFWSLRHSNPAFATELKIFFFGAVVLAGVVGGLTVSRSIFYVQALPAVLGLVLSLLNT